MTSDFSIDDLAGDPTGHGDSPRKKLETALARWERKKANLANKLTTEQRKRDMGLGYLIWVIRRRNRISQRELARRIGVTASALCRWEAGNRVPSLKNLQAIANENRYELMIGLWDIQQKDVALLGILEHELPVTELDLIEDPYSTESPPPRPWRERLPSA